MVNIDVVRVAAGTADAEAAVAANTHLKLYGFSVAETAASAAVAEVIILHGATQAAGTQVVAPVNLAADGFGQFSFNFGIPCPNGITIDRVAGNTTLVLYIGYC